MSRNKTLVNDLRMYEKLLSRDFSLPSVEAWVNGEIASATQWMKGKQQLLPYIIAERSDNTVRFYYDLGGPISLPDYLIKRARVDKTFIPQIAKTVIDNIPFIRSIYEKEQAVNLDQLKRFTKELKNAYSYCNAMWLFADMDEDKVKGLNLKSLNIVRKMTERLCDSSDMVIRKSLLKIYPQLGELSSVLLTNEIGSRTIPTLKMLKIRYDGYFYANNQLFTDVDKSFVSKKFHLHFKNVKVKKTKILKGNIIQQGIVRGFVRRLMGHKEINELKTDEILVSPMTIPDFLPAMKKAAAIVTDEGGVLCHAAIVARELKKPCIVGTKFATQILKDGDLVKVDANKGIVTILK